ncbi:hypothetical protein LTR72_005885 [Exophiala xenobiotica]|nr:hypothetical protein LTR41_006203 [Exophiala xenobiotica]KAK5223048.1 hypothetical protein LTR72_005885 [Exophiala xenobiotica]KAK5297132.1 hypothetical protein LTR14_002863 [Exophiala xenobiotica]KAK5486049.1 hypothetical protein LTR55_005727 [Exophiala xenobiotica]
MQHFIQNLATWFDLFDPHRRFALEVPNRASICPTLQKAIFALAARHLSQLTDLDPLLANRYYQQCIEELIPRFEDLNAMLDEDLLCATVILRLLEELDVSITGYDNERHLRGIQILGSAQAQHAAMSGGLREAAFWAGLHQEVFMAFATQRSATPLLSSYCSIDRSFAPADDRTWTCRILVHCAEILTFCFGQGQAQRQTPNGSDSNRRVVEWQHHLDYAHGWHASRPRSCFPFFSSPPTSGSVFPSAYYHLPVQLTGALYYHLCLVLLALNNPMLESDFVDTYKNRIQAMRQSAQALKVLDQEVRLHVRALCGIALCNGYLTPATTIASTALSICGEHFAADVDRHEQEALLDILVQNEIKHGWPTSAAQQRLKRLWNWHTDV